MLAVGNACLPARGMRAVPEQLASRLKRKISLSAPVEAVEAKRLKVAGEWRDYAAVVVAVDRPAASKLLPSLSKAEGTRSATFYFGLASPAPIEEPLIILQSPGSDADRANQSSRVVNIGFPSVVQKSYAPPGRELAAITVRGEPVDEAWVKREVERILGVNCAAWAHIKTYDIGYHQPAQVPLTRPDEVPLQLDGVHCCGDHCSNPTLDGAMRSGRRTAEAVSQILGHG